MSKRQNILLRSLLALAAFTVLIFTSCTQNKPVTPDGSKPNEYSAYLFSAANVLYYDNQFEKAEEIYRAALKFDPNSKEIKKAIFNTLFARIKRKEIPLEHFSGYADTLLAQKAMDRAMLEMSYDVFFANNEKLMAEQILKVYLKKYASPNAYTALFYLEQQLYDKNRLELLDKAFSLAKDDAAFLNSLGIIYFAFNKDKSEKIWQRSAEIDTTFKAKENLWRLYFSQKRIEDQRKIWQSFNLPQEKAELLGLLEAVLKNNEYRSLLIVSDLILETGDPDFIFELMHACWAEKADDKFALCRNALEKTQLNPVEYQQLYFYNFFFSLWYDKNEEALNWISKLDGKMMLDEILALQQVNVVSAKGEQDTLKLKQVKEQLRSVVLPATEEQMASPVKNYLLAAIDVLDFSSPAEVADSLTFACAKWFYDNNRRTYETYLTMAQYYNKTKQDSLQKAIILEALEEYPQDASLLNWLGYSYVLSNEKLDEAEALIRRALQISPDNPFYLDSLAWLYYTKGEYETAFELMDIPAQQGDMPSEVAFHIAKILLALNENDAALVYLKLTIEIGDDPDYVNQAQQIMDEMP